MPQLFIAHTAGQRCRKARARRILFSLATLGLAFGAQAEDASSQLAIVVENVSTTTLHVVNTNDGAAAPVELGACTPDAKPAWSLKGSVLVYEAPRPNAPGTQIAWHVWGASQPESSGVCGALHAYNRHPAASPDGRYIAYEGYAEHPHESALVVFDRETGEEQIWGGSRRALFTPEWLPNPKLLLSLDPNRKVDIPGVDLNAIRQESGLADGSSLSGGPTRALFCVGLEAPGGALTTELLLATQSQTLPVLALVPDGPDSTRYSEWNPRISPGGTRVVFESDYGGDREVYQLDQNGLLNLSNHRTADWNPVWTANGRWVAMESFRDGTRGIYRILVETVRVEPVITGDYWSPSWSPNGEEMAVVLRRDNALRVAVIEVESGKETLLSLPTGSSAWAPAWRPKP